MRVALPYYGQLMHPILGLSRLFFVADVDRDAGKVTQMRLATRQPQAGQGLSGWLQEHNINGVLSADSPDQQLTELISHGLWHQPVPEEEPHDQVNYWLKTHFEMSDRVANQSPACT